MWGPVICLDCKATPYDYCETCSIARKMIRQPSNREAYNTYQREYQRRARACPVQGSRMREAGRERSRRFRERKKNESPDT